MPGFDVKLPRIAIIGYGTISRAVIEIASNALSPETAYAVLTRNPGKLKDIPSLEELSNIDELISFRPDVVVEAAGHEALEAYAPVILTNGISLITASVGALARRDLFEQLSLLARVHSAKLVIPSGAIGALDYIAAVALIPGTTIAYRSSKPMAAWSSELKAMGIELEAQTKQIEIFAGDAITAGQAHRNNANVAVALALTSSALGVPQASLVADPHLTLNTHEITVTGPAGNMHIRIENRPMADNPKTPTLQC
ncbi:hypothetical protein AJ87_17105 [Rhizobium yanglingense]|nr:hypothetical protein AJ87_17105 [Rhizobium yanglingense]